MTDEKNVLLTVVHKEEEERDELVLDLGTVWKQVKRLFVFWLCLAVGVGALSGASALLVQNVIEPKETKTLIAFPGDRAYDVNKIKSPAVVEDALSAMGFDLKDLSRFQGAVKIQSVIPNAAYERMSMYYDMLSKNPSSVNLLDTLLDTQYQSSQYIVSFDYASAEVSVEEGVAFLNQLLVAFEDYCAFYYNYNTPLNNPLSMIDYHDYDYAEAVNIFANALDNISSYLSTLNGGEGASFRSTKTGFTFQDLSRTLSVLRDVNLDRISSYVVIHSISTYDAETEISYYQWRIENLTRQRAVERTRLSSLTDSIDAYEKDSLVIIASQDGGSVVSGSQSINANYDDMIQRKLSAQAAIASYTRSISFYESVIEGFRNSGASSSPEDIAKVNEYLEILNNGVNHLIQNVSATADEYYEKVSFSNEIRVLVPATVEKTHLISSFAVKLVLAVEVLLFAGYLFYAFVLGMRETNPPKTERKEKQSDLQPDENGAEAVRL